MIRAVTHDERDRRRIDLSNQLHKPPLLHSAQTAADARETDKTRQDDALRDQDRQ